jgi:hypothetical protein
MWSTSWAHLEHQAMAQPIVAQRAQHELGLWRPWSSESQRSQRSQRSVGADGQGFPAASRTFRWDQGLLMIHDYINTNININYNMIIIHSRIPAHFLRSNCEADRFSLPAYLASNHVDVWVTGSYMYSIAFKPRKQTRGKLGNINIICFVDLCWRSWAEYEGVWRSSVTERIEIEQLPVSEAVTVKQRAASSSPVRRSGSQFVGLIRVRSTLKSEKPL